MAIRAIHPVRPIGRVEEVEDDQAVTTTTHASNVLARVIWLVAGIILALLTFRFLFALLGANPHNGFANFIYTTSHPFVVPFFGLFKYNYVNNGIGRFELFTLIAIAVYAVIAAVLARIATLNRPSSTY